MRRLALLALPGLAAYVACQAGRDTQPVTTTTTTVSSGAGGAGGGTGGAVTSTGGSGFGGFFGAGGYSDAGLDPDAACATATEVAPVTLLPVDIIWMVDNSASMIPAIAEVTAGLNDFAALIGSSNLDYRVVMLSLRSATSPVVIGGSNRYPVCIPPPLAGDSACGDGPRFFQSSIDLRSTQPLEQFLGTLAQTPGYQPGDSRGGDPWAQFLRPEATKTIVIVTDDNARMSKSQFETFPGGQNPWNSTTLPPGILDPSWNGLFAHYIFSGIYGYGSDVDPAVKCTYPDQTQPPASGVTYTDLVLGTGGVRAKLCDGAAAWGPFFDAVAQAVVATAQLTCSLDIPVPQGDPIDYNLINVILTGGANDVYLPKVADASGCAPDGGWYYDDPQAPTQVVLCPESCELANSLVGPNKPGNIQVQFGCQSILK
ncbi:MAG: hypothetical protein HY908_32975 [Myxococcales bacterium]|nr:hypothetical protein [Myxococcales bacterium]